MRKVPVEKHRRYTGTPSKSGSLEPCLLELPPFGDKVRVVPSDNFLIGKAELVNKDDGSVLPVCTVILSISGMGLSHAFSPDEAREAAAELFNMADECERETD